MISSSCAAGEREVRMRTQTWAGHRKKRSDEEGREGERERERERESDAGWMVGVIQ